MAALVGQTFSSPFNPDKKLLAFSDSVQDASHRAGFLTARAWTFSFRTAICSVLAASNDSCSLSEFSRLFLDYWKEKTGSAERFAGIFLPPDLEWFEDYEVLKSTGALPAGSDLAEKLSLRLCWEIASEFTFRSRIGRTLERTGTAIASFNPDALERAAVDVASEAAERQERFRLVEPSHPEWRRLLWGILYRFKNLGAVNEPSIRALFEYGSTFPFQRTRRHMPGFSKRAPHIVTAFSRTNIHESLAAVDKRKTWFEAWTARCAAALLPGFAFDSPDENAELLQLAIASLERAGLVSRLLLEKENTGWLIEPASLVVTQDVVRCRCSVCAGALDVADADRGLAEGMRCLRSGCRGAYRASDTEASDYYRNFYRRGEVVRINGREHTGLLGGKERKELEERFIAGADPWDPNLLSATPTLEMGINIGDLSTVFLCSVPPAVANYLQRIGRAGRVDGNANILTMANAAPHDQYFFQSPAEMLEGSIDAPAIYDRAVAVLERHLTAYAIGRWMKDMNALADPVPSTVGDLIAAWNGENYEVFPRAFDSALARESESWLEGFFSVFDHLETGGSEQAYLREWLSQDPATERTLVRTLGACLDSAASAVESMRSRRNALRKRAADIRAQGALTEELAKECEELDREADGLRSGIEQLRQTETWQYLCDEGILPNYAFPESGVKLKATFYRKNKNKTKSEFSYTHVELVRSASSALCEFAPENEFFGNGHRMKINRVDLKTSTLETWRFCPACSHAVSETHEHFKMSDCPVCRNPGWADAGQVHFLLRFRQVFSFSDYKSSLISDSQEDREPVFYNTKLLVDFDPADPENKYFGLEDNHAPFAIEFIKRATFREINFGRVDGGPQGFPVAGEDDSKSGFPVCTFCGSLDSDRHTPDCPDRAKSIADQSTKRVIHLYHEFRSEAIRLLAPVNEYPLQSEIALESTIAGIYLGLKKHFGGKADHLRITRERSETAGGARLHYIVVYDSIPGGSGYLKDFFTEAAASADGAGATTFFAVLEKALEALQNCRCKNDPEKDGCYRCVLSHKVSRKMKDVSRTMAIDVIQRMMVERANLRKLNEQAAARVDPLSDSKLEELFAAVLESPDRWPVAVSVKPEMFHGKTGRYVQIGSRGYHLEQQVPITVARPYRASCLADFVFFPVANGERPVVVFTDGFRYHKDILAQDLRTRFALIQSGEYRVFSFSWEDIASIAENRPSELDRAKHPWLQPALAKEAAKRFQQFKIENSSWPGVKEDASPEAFVSMLSLCEADRDAQWLNKARHSAMLHFLSSTEAARPAAELSERAGTDFGKNQAFVTKKLSEQAAHELTLILGMGAPFTVSSLDLWLEFDDSAELDRFEWNSLLDLVNLYQIFPHFACAAKSAAAEKDWMAYAFAGTDVRTAEAASEWAPVYDCVLSAWKPLVSQLADRNAPIPEVGFEEIDGSGTVLFTAELAWPELKIAVLAHERSDQEADCGWTFLYWKPDEPFPEFDFGGNT
ncbi:MAG TPA: DUF1998 domain-containing protein [Treponemataceae bacterium]|nr:DUF1998 domain-containing protein [Treponemataceae bacterium]